MSDLNLLKLLGSMCFAFGIGACWARLQTAMRKHDPLRILAYGIAICILLRALIVLTASR